MPLVTLVLCVLLLSASCGGERDESAQAEALLQRISALDPDAPRHLRRDQLAALAALSLEDAALSRVRDRCFEAHAGLLQAELEQAAARKRLEALERKAAGQPVEPAEAARVAAAIRRSEQALAEAKGPFEECGRRTRELTLRHR